jgi:uncharacterized membrane-anchored protein
MNSPESQVPRNGLSQLKYQPLAFGLALLLQAGLMLSVPLRGLPTRWWGNTVVLETIPVALNNLSNQPTHLRYKIAQRSKLRELPGGAATFAKVPQTPVDFFVTLEPSRALGKSGLAATAATRQPKLQPWNVVKVSRDRPNQLKAQQVILQGQDTGQDWVRYGMEQYRLPQQIQQQLNPAAGAVRYPALNVEVKTDPVGQGLPIALWVGKSRYRF